MNEIETLDIKVNKSETSTINQVDFNNLKFGEVKSDHMFIAKFEQGKWSNLEIKPFQDIALSPACLGLHYGQSIFEGLKAFKHPNGDIGVFRPDKNAERFAKSAIRMGMEPLPKEIFLEGMRALLKTDSTWVPTGDDMSLYIRPFQFADEPNIGVRPSSSYTFIIFTCPVGKYYDKSVSVYVEDFHVRAVRGGAGEAKAAGNYAPTLVPAKKVKEKGFDQILWTQEINGTRYAQEIGTMNFFVQIDDVLITPEEDGSILQGITKESLIMLAKDKGIKVEEKMLSLDELFDAARNGRVNDAFGAGTAAVISQIDAIGKGDERIELKPVSDRTLSHALKAELTGMQRGIVEDRYNWMMKV